MAKKKAVAPPMVDSLDEDYVAPIAVPEPVVVEVPDGGYELLPSEVAEPFDTVVVSRVPVCEEKTGVVLKMNHFNAAGQLVR
jgi:hypothetical protein